MTRTTCSPLLQRCRLLPQPSSSSTAQCTHVGLHACTARTLDSPLLRLLPPAQSRTGTAQPANACMSGCTHALHGHWTHRCCSRCSLLCAAQAQLNHLIGQAVEARVLSQPLYSRKMRHVLHHAINAVEDPCRLGSMLVQTDSYDSTRPAQHAPCPPACTRCRTSCATRGSGCCPAATRSMTD